MSLRRADAWQPVYEAMNLAWIERGCCPPDDHGSYPAAMLQRIGARQLPVGAEDQGIAPAA